MPESGCSGLGAVELSMAASLARQYRRPSVNFRDPEGSLCSLLAILRRDEARTIREQIRSRREPLYSRVDHFAAWRGLPLSRRIRVLCHLVDYHNQTIELPSEEEAAVAAQ
jgi:hypothetical protein